MMVFADVKIALKEEKIGRKALPGEPVRIGES
jgi:hypothetical protein